MGVRRTREGSNPFVRRLPLFLILVILFFSLFYSPPAYAQVQVRLRAIHASNAGSSVDPSLGDLYKELGSLFSFTSYRLMREETLNLYLNRSVSILAREGRIILEVTLVGLHKNMAELRLRVVREGTEILNTQVRLSPGRTILVGGPKHLRGGVVIYALYARF
jgi:hypothetical protein